MTQEVVMGARGPVPQRSDQRRRRNKPADGEITKAEAASAPVVQPPASDSWHEMAADWYRSLAESGQAVFYQASDWQTARVWAEVLSRQLEQSRLSAQMVAAWASAAGELLTTEGSRRRARLELQVQRADEDEDASVTALDAYRADLGA